MGDSSNFEIEPPTSNQIQPGQIQPKFILRFFGKAFTVFFSFVLTILCTQKISLGAEEKPLVFTLKTQREKVADLAIYPALVKSEIEATLNAPAEGLVQGIIKSAGQKVKKGDPLIVIQNTDPVYQYAPVSIKSPLDAYVASVHVGLLSKVEKGQRLLTLTSPDRILIQVEIPASDLSRIQIGSEGLFRLNTMETSVRVKALSPIVDPKTGTATAELEQKNKSAPGSLFPGQMGQAVFRLNEREQFLLPQSALIYQNGKPSVRTIQETKVRKVEVELGVFHGSQVEILSGLDQNMEVVTQTSRYLREGDEVQTQQQQQQQPKPDKTEKQKNL